MGAKLRIRTDHRRAAARPCPKGGRQVFCESRGWAGGSPQMPPAHTSSAFPLPSSMLPLHPHYPKSGSSAGPLKGNFFTNASTFSWLICFLPVPKTSPEIELQALIIKSGLDSRTVHVETIKRLHFSRGACQPCQMLAASARWAFDIR